jgi:hypothetical protein
MPNQRAPGRSEARCLALTSAANVISVSSSVDLTESFPHLPQARLSGSTFVGERLRPGVVIRTLRISTILPASLQHLAVGHHKTGAHEPDKHLPLGGWDPALPRGPLSSAAGRMSLPFNSA